MNVGRAIIDLFRFDRTNWKAVALCVVAATVFWFFNALNKPHTTTLAFPLKVEFDQQRYIAAEPLPDAILINVTGSGWDLLRKSLGFHANPISLTLEHPLEITRLPGSAIPTLARDLGNMNINRVVTDTLRFHIEARQSRKFKLTLPVAGISFKDGFGLTSPVVILPDSVTVSGPASMIAAMPDTLPVQFQSRKISGNVKAEAEVLTGPSAVLSRNPPTVTVMFEAGEVIEEPKTIPVSLENSPSRQVFADRDCVAVVLRFPKSLPHEWWQSNHGLKALVDLSQVKKGRQHILVKVVGLPPTIHYLSADSVLVTRY